MADTHSDTLPSWLSWTLGLMAGVGMWEFIRSAVKPWSPMQPYTMLLLLPCVAVFALTLIYVGIAAWLQVWPRLEGLRTRALLRRKAPRWE